MTSPVDCRFCLERKKHVFEMNDEIRTVFFAITQMKVNLSNFDEILRQNFIMNHQKVIKLWKLWKKLNFS